MTELVQKLREVEQVLMWPKYYDLFFHASRVIPKLDDQLVLKLDIYVDILLTAVALDGGSSGDIEFKYHHVFATIQRHANLDGTFSNIRVIKMFKERLVDAELVGMYPNL